MMNCLEANRKDLNLSRAALAKAIGVNVVTVWRWETEDMDISHNSLLRLAEFFQCAVTDLVPEYGTVHASPNATEEGQTYDDTH